MPDAPKYHPEVKVYDVTDSKGEHVAVFMTDYFPRSSKRQGAWMSELKGSYTKDDGTSSRPIIYNVCNFSKPTADAPSLLTLDEVETMFHEFGHGLHGMLTRARYKSQAGTNVDRDFVELPSQIHEHWAMEPELLKVYARHYKTGEVIPEEMIAKLQAASNHNQGFTTTELVGAALLDLQWGKIAEYTGDIDVEKFEREVADRLGKPAEVQYRYRSRTSSTYSAATAMQPATIPTCGPKCLTATVSSYSRRKAYLIPRPPSRSARMCLSPATATIR